MRAVPPKVLHYGLKYEVAETEYAFDKHWHYHFDATLCPPWDMDTEMPKGGLFMHPPAPSTLTTEVSSPEGTSPPLEACQMTCMGGRLDSSPLYTHL